MMQSGFLLFSTRAAEAIALPIMLMVGLVALAMPILSAIWVYRDAAARNNPNAAIWAVGTVLAWFAVIVVYLVVRPDYRSQGPATPV